MSTCFKAPHILVVSRLYFDGFPLVVYSSYIASMSKLKDPAIGGAEDKKSCMMYQNLDTPICTQHKLKADYGVCHTKGLAIKGNRIKSFNKIKVQFCVFSTITSFPYYNVKLS